MRRFKFRFPLNIYAFTFKSYLTLSKLHFLSIITLQLNSSMDQWAYFIVSENDFLDAKIYFPFSPSAVGNPLTWFLLQFTLLASVMMTNTTFHT